MCTIKKPQMNCNLLDLSGDGLKKRVLYVKNE